MPAASLTLLGGFDARLDSGVALALPTHKYKALLAFLAVPAGQVHPRDRLVALLWGDRSHDQGRTALRQALWVLRKAFNTMATAGLVIDGDLISLDPSAVRVDVAEFERAVTGAAGDLERAAALYRGEFLAGVAARETPFEDWLTVQRQRLGELAVQALARLLAHQRKTGDLEAAIQTALRLLALDPLEEPVHRVLMHMYVDLGRRAAALRQYQMCVGVLQRELGNEPEAQTRALYRSILLERVPSAVNAPLQVSVANTTLPVAPASPKTTTPLIGRALETTLIREALDEAAAGRGQIVVILGEAGMGKSRLVEALSADAAGRGAAVIVGHCFESERVLPYGPWTAALRHTQLASEPDVLATLPARTRAALGRFIPELVPDDSGRDPSASDHMQVFDSVARLVEVLTTQRPLALIIEDAHWADDISLRLLAFLARRVHGTLPVLIALTARSEELADAPTLQGFLDDLDRQHAPLHISLASLDRSDTERLVNMLAGARDPATLARLNESIWAASQGSPFMVVETLHAVREGAAADASGELPLPERVRRVVARRLERLTPAARQLVATAAVIGRDFTFGLLQRASSVAEDEAIEAVEELVRRHIFVEAGEGFDFSHDRIREVARQALLPPRRLRLHRQVAEKLEAMHGASIDAHAAVLGHHYRAAEVWDRAVSFLHRAGTQALVRGAYREAAAMMEQAVQAQERLPAGSVTPQEVFDLRLQATPSLFSTADMERFGERVAEIVTRAERLGDRARLSRAYTHSCEYLRSQHEYTRALEAGEKALGLAIGVGDADLKTRATFQLGCVYAWRGEEQRALEHFEAATAEPFILTEGAAVGSSSGFPYLPALARRVMALAELGRFSEALPLAAYATALVEAGVQPAAFALAYVGGLCLAQGRIEEAISQFLHSLDVQRERGFQIARAFCTSSLAEAYAVCGRRAEASAVLEETADWYRSMPGPAQRSLVLTRLGSALLLVDRVDDARRYGSRALDFTLRYGEPGSEANARHLLGQVMLHDALSSPELAEVEFREALGIATRLGMRPLAAHCRRGLARVSQRRGKHDDARDHILAATTMYREMEMFFWLDRTEELAIESREALKRD